MIAITRRQRRGRLTATAVCGPLCQVVASVGMRCEPADRAADTPVVGCKLALHETWGILPSVVSPEMPHTRRGRKGIGHTDAAADTFNTVLSDRQGVGPYARCNR
jgi:hypothetical protein